MTCLRKVAALVAVLCLLPSVPALAARKVTITGGGWGHGIGMSQYGAYGRAKRGHNATQILQHYYSGARVRQGDLPGNIRVGLLEYRSSISATSSAFKEGGGRIAFKVAGDSGQIAQGPAGTDWRVEPSSTGGMRLYRNGDQVRVDGRSVFGDATHPLVARYERFGSLLRINEKAISYAYGRMEFGTFTSDRCPDDQCLRLVLSLPFQKYLYGLGEVPFSWPAAALRSQVIAARTYAYEKVLRTGQHLYPCECAVYDSTLDQVYSGDSKRVPSGIYWDDWVAAVDDTKGKVILYRGNPIQALYSSSSGGHTENNENVWGGTPLPYLRGVPDAPDDNPANPNHTWSVSMSFRAFADELEKEYNDDPDTRFGDLRSFKLVRPFGVSGRVTVVKPGVGGGVRIEGTTRELRVSGWSIRGALGLMDSLFRVKISRT
jgi:stage II sporulation protein D